jgi:hypothetical protein
MTLRAGVRNGAVILALVGCLTAGAASARADFARSTAFGAPAPVLAGPDAASLAGSSLALEVPGFDRFTVAAEAPAANPAGNAATALNGERAAVLLRSLTLPGWGQATLGYTGAAKAFGLTEVAIWASFAAFRVQGAMRTDAYERTASLLAGIDLNGRDDEFRRIVGSFRSSDEYNQLVVFRDAANLYYDNPDQYRAYIEEHSLKGPNQWSWNSDASLLRYRGQRKDAQRASLRANTALAAAVVNRLFSAVHAGRAASHPRNTSRSWNFEAAPADPNDATAFRFGVHTRF